MPDRYRQRPAVHGGRVHAARRPPIAYGDVFERDAGPDVVNKLGYYWAPPDAVDLVVMSMGPGHAFSEGHDAHPHPGRRPGPQLPVLRLHGVLDLDRGPQSCFSSADLEQTEPQLVSAAAVGTAGRELGVRSACSVPCCRARRIDGGQPRRDVKTTRDGEATSQRDADAAASGIIGSSVASGVAAVAKPAPRTARRRRT